MKPLHVFAAALIVAMWGLNFTVIRYGLDEYTPFTFATWRFLLAALPVLFVKKPAISWGTLAGIGGFMFGGQFVFLFFAMQAGLPPGLTSVLVQLQGPLTVVLAALFLGEHATRGQWLGLAVAAVGVVLIARSVEGTASLFAIGLALMSALTWATGNLFFRTARGVSMFAVTAWDLEGLVRALLHGRAGDVAGLPDLGNAFTHLSRRQGRADIPARALCRPGLCRLAGRRTDRRPAARGRDRRAGRRGAGAFRFGAAAPVASHDVATKDCHPERSEGPLIDIAKGSLASLGMTTLSQRRQAVSNPHHSAMNSAVAWVILRIDSRFTRSSKPWMSSDCGP